MIPEDEINYVNSARIAKASCDRGVSIQAGGHGQREGLSLHWEMWMLEQGGMSPIDVLKAATINGARTFGLDRDLGSLESGKLADFAILEANPLENIRNSTSVRMTVANGRVYDSGLNEIGTRKRSRPPFWFAQPGGSGSLAQMDAVQASLMEED